MYKGEKMLIIFLDWLLTILVIDLLFIFLNITFSIYIATFIWLFLIIIRNYKLTRR